VIVSHRARCIFVHIQKTGGSSIERLLRQHDPAIGSNLHDGRRHVFARDMRAFVDPAVWNAYLKFAFVRNPWDRLVSWYHMCVQNESPNRFSQYVKDNAPTFSDFVTKTITGIAERTTWNQLDYVTDATGEVIVDFIGRYERLGDDLAAVTARLGVAFDLPHVNRSRRGDYREYYTAATAEIVARRFARDIEHFGYRF
jgi:hypothetical protein